MAKATTLIDDMDGETTGALTRHFSVEGIDYSIDLTDDNYWAFLRTIEPWRSVSRIARKPRKRAHRPLTPEERKQIREWATDKGIELAERGRFPNHVVSGYLREQELDDAYQKLAEEDELATLR